MSRILVLSGSPRRDGNTDRLVDSFVKGVSPGNEVEVIHVCDYSIHPCIGCNTCFSREGNKCFRDDDMTLVYDRLGKADIVIIASPVYFYGISAQLKAVVDRLHTPMRNSFPIQKLGLILVGAAELPELFDSILTQYRLILKFFSLEDGGTFLARGAREKGSVTDDDLKKAYQLGQSIQ